LLLKSTNGNETMTNMKKILMTLVCAMGSCALALAQAAAPAAAPARIAPADAKNRVGEVATVCGKVVESKINKYGIAGHGKPGLFYIDQPQASAVFYFVAFGTKDGGPDEVIAAYTGKSVCVTGTISTSSGVPYIMAADRTSIKPKTD
jgi:hypothetical protein